MFFLLMIVGVVVFGWVAFHLAIALVILRNVDTIMAVILAVIVVSCVATNYKPTPTTYEYPPEAIDQWLDNKGS